MNVISSMRVHFLLFTDHRDISFVFKVIIVHCCCHAFFSTSVLIVFVMT